jgi:hypothetical protein
LNIGISVPTSHSCSHSNKRFFWFSVSLPIIQHASANATVIGRARELYIWLGENIYHGVPRSPRPVLQTADQLPQKLFFATSMIIRKDGDDATYATEGNVSPRTRSMQCCVNHTAEPGKEGWTDELSLATQSYTKARILTNVKHFLAPLRGNPKEILDLGCGLGMSVPALLSKKALPGYTQL